MARKSPVSYNNTSMRGKYGPPRKVKMKRDCLGRFIKHDRVHPNKIKVNGVSVVVKPFRQTWLESLGAFGKKYYASRNPK